MVTWQSAGSPATYVQVSAGSKPNHSLLFLSPAVFGILGALVIMRLVRTVR